MPEQFDSISVTESISVGAQNQQDARVEIKSPVDGSSNRVVADAAGRVLVGGNRASGVLLLFNEGTTHADLNRATMRLNAETGLLELGLFDGGETKITIEMRSNEAAIRAGGQGTDGSLILERKDGSPGITLEAEHPQVVLGSAGQAGSFVVKDPAGLPAITLAGQSGRISAEEGRYREVIVIDKGGAGRIGIDGNTATMRIGFQDTPGHVILRSDKAETIVLDGERAEIQMGGAGKAGTGRLVVKDPKGASTITLNGQNGQVDAKQGSFRDLIVIDDGGTGRVGIDGQTATMRIGFQDKAGHLILRSDKGETIHLDGMSGNARLGGNGVNGDLFLFGDNVTDTGDATKARIQFLAASGQAKLGGNGRDGDLMLFADNVTDGDSKKARIHLDGQFGQARLGGNGATGDLLLFANDVTDIGDATKARIQLLAAKGDARLGGNGVNGELLLFAEDVTDTGDFTKSRIRLDATLGNAWLGGNGVDGDLALFSKKTPLTGITNAVERAKLATIHLDGEAGDIILRNADCAEEFNVADAEHVEPGSVVVISSENELTISTQAYDKRVAGIVSGAGSYRPGLLLDKQHQSKARLSVSLMGKVYCKVDATHGPIEAGDLLTSSDRPGHAMKLTDPVRAVGAILGKALKPLKSGSGLIPVLVTLQ
jgi:hypothetical protein